MSTADPLPDFANDPLDAVAVRVLGALAEKAFTTPDNYPLSLNSLTSACNQSSNRDPVMALDEDAVSRGIDDLARRGLARAVHRSDSRVRRYRHGLEDTLHLHPAEMAALCVLLLRGPQTVGEIRSRTNRMVEFIDLSHVEITLQALASATVPLVVQLPRQPGQKEARYAHLLAGVPPDTPAEPMVVPAGGEVEPGRMDALEQEVAALRTELADLKAAFETFRREFQ